MVFSKNNIRELCGTMAYMKTIYELDLSSNKMNLICEDTLAFLENSTLRSLNLANNNISMLPSKISNIKTLQSVKLSGNNFACNCDMTWMIDWFTKRIVEDYDKVKCKNGKMIGRHIYNLTREEMGCYPHKLSLGEKLTIGILGTLIIIIVIFIIAVGRRWNEVKWLLYLHFNILDKSDRNEDLTGKKYDAFLCYK